METRQAARARSCRAGTAGLVLVAAAALVAPAAAVPPAGEVSAGAFAQSGREASRFLAQRASAARPLPSSVDTRAGVLQMVTVTSRRWQTTRATVRVWERRRGGRWHLARTAIPARIGWNGWARGPRRQQGSGTSPAGKYRLPRAFGSRPDPGGALPYRRFDRNDYWPYEPRDPATYNVYQRHKAAGTHWRRGYRERLWDFRDQYRYAVVVGFNLPSGVHYSRRRRQWVARDRADTDRGGGIFLHVTDGGPTAGCVAMRVRPMRRLTRWLDPQKRPLVVLGPRRYVVERL